MEELVEETAERVKNLESQIAELVKSTSTMIQE
jgi:septal ring factor EnvC (AmiA/AmiB activator)